MVMLSACGRDTSGYRGSPNLRSACESYTQVICTMEYAPTICRSGNLAARGGNGCSARAELQRVACEAGRSDSQIQSMSVSCQADSTASFLR